MQVVKNEIRTALLVLVSLAVVVGIVLYLSAPGVFKPMKTFHIYFDNAAGIQQGASVYLAGRKVGRVTRLFSPVPPAERPKVEGGEKYEVLIDIQVDEGAKIYRDVSVRMMQYGFLTELIIDFTEGVESSGLAEDDHYYVGVRDPGIAEAVPTILEKIDPVVKAATDTLETLKATAANLNQITAPESEFNLALTRFRTFGDNLVKLSSEDGELDQALENFEALTSKEGDLGQALANINRITTDLANNKDIERTLSNLREATTKLDNAIDELGPQFTTIGGNLEQWSDTLKRQPWRLIWPSTKRYPEEEPEPARPKAEPRKRPRRSSDGRR
jgi:phospholipid/cholesterol/gamma-HCH transport system substrate-binding protein